MHCMKSVGCFEILYAFMYSLNDIVLLEMLCAGHVSCVRPLSIYEACFMESSIKDTDKPIICILFIPLVNLMVSATCLKLLIKCLHTPTC